LGRFPYCNAKNRGAWSKIEKFKLRIRVLIIPWTVNNRPRNTLGFATPNEEFFENTKTAS
jgi:hypothetical protein